MEEKKDTISIIVPCYNVETYVTRCLEKIANQTYQNIEVLLIDDGSTDKTREEIEKYIQQDARFHYFYKKNGGLSDARNYGLKRMTGEYVCFIDSDDYIEPTYIEDLYNAIQKEHTKLAICGFKRVYPNKETYEPITERMVDLCIRPAAWNKMYHKSLFLESGIEFPVSKWYEDLGTTTKLIFMTDKNYAIVDKCLYNYIQNGSSIMHTYDDRIFDIYDVLEEIERFMKERQLYQKYRDNVEFMHIYHILVGTMYRASFHKKFSQTMMQDILNYVEKKYPNWYHNPYLKEQKTVYKLYYYLLKKKRIFTLYFLLKHLAKYMYL